MSSLLVIGAGPAGLTAAYEASRLGLSPTIVESDSQVGGLARTVNYRGYRLDIGGHRFFSKVPLINELWQEILGENFLVRPRLSRIYYDNHFFNYPLKAFDTLAGLGPLEVALVCFSYTKARLFPHKDETSFEQWVSNRFGERLYKIFFKTYTEKVWGIPCNEISADWAAQRIKNLSLHEAVRNALLGGGRDKDGRIISTLIERFNYPRHGPGMMWECCRDILSARGHETIQGIKVNRLRHRRGRVEAVYGQDAAGQNVEFGADHFISTMPLRQLIRSLDPLPPDKVLQAADRLRYRNHLTVILIIKRESVFPDNWIYIHSPEVIMGRIQNYKNWSPEMVPDQSRTSLGLEYFLWENDDEWHWSDQRLIERGIRECARIGLTSPDEVEDGTVVRMKKAYPVYERDYQSNLATLREYIKSFSNLQTIGRNGLHRYNNQDHSMLTGVFAARNIMGEWNDLWSVNTEKEYHEEELASSGHTGDRLVPARIGVNQVSDKLITATFARLDPLSLGISVGSVVGLGLFFMTIILLLKGGDVIEPNLALLRNYFPWFATTWSGAFIGMIEGGIFGFGIGLLTAWLRNWCLDAYTTLLKSRAGYGSEEDLTNE
jgi:protoporphyrinogen oxidase